MAFPIISDLRKSHTLCDVVINVGDVTFKAHKIVLVSFLLNFVHFVTGGRGRVKANMFVPGNSFQPLIKYLWLRPEPNVIKLFSSVICEFS